MSFSTQNELEHFNFEDSYLADIQTGMGVSLIIDNVKILPENSCNRDIRVMRCNQLELKLVEGKLLRLVEEGNKIYNADGALLRQEESKEVQPEDYKETFELLMGKEIFLLERKESEDKATYQVEIGGDEHLYTLYLEGKSDIENWDRFLNLGAAF